MYRKRRKPRSSTLRLADQAGLCSAVVREAIPLDHSCWLRLQPVPPAFLRSLIRRSTQASEALCAVLRWDLGLGGDIWDIDPLNKVPFKRAISRVKKGPL